MKKKALNVGLLGSGQLGKMFAYEAKRHGYNVILMDPNDDGPAISLSDEHIKANYTDKKALDKLANICHAVTTEFENIPSSALEYIHKKTFVSPKSNSVSIAQDRYKEKNFIRNCGLKTANFKKIYHDICIDDFVEFIPGIIKTTKLGYDGKGQFQVNSLQSLKKILKKLNKENNYIIEKKIEFVKEISVIIARDRAKDIVVYPLFENTHKKSILDFSLVPARIPTAVEKKAQVYARKIAENLDYVGVLCVEMFLQKDNSIIINEFAPRPHNSGHLTIDSFNVNQFELQLRTLCGLPLIKPKIKNPCVMVNILGDNWKQFCLNINHFYRNENVKLHLYGKKLPKIGRKMGHFTIQGVSVTGCMKIAKKLQKKLF